MNLQSELAEKVLRGEKTVTRRLVNANVHSPWFIGGCSLRERRDYAVCPGRGKHAICRVQVVNVRKERLGWLTPAEARNEGFDSPHAFELAFGRINGSYIPDALVWRVEFRLVPGSSRTVGQEDPNV